jgi:hypothetical protein
MASLSLIKFERKHKCGDFRADGYRFQCYYNRSGKVEEKWRSPEAFQRWRRQSVLKVTRRRRDRADVRLRHAQSEARRRQDPAYKHRQTIIKRRWRERRCAVDSGFKILCRLRKRLWDAVQGHRKSAPTRELIGTSVEGLKLQIEAGFLPGMSWENYGSVWEIDHKIPCAQFDMSNEAQQRACFHYANLRPLWRGENRSRGVKI